MSCWYSQYQWASLSPPIVSISFTSGVLDLVCELHLICPEFMEGLPAGLTDMQSEYNDNDTQQVPFLHLKVHAESPPVYPEVAEGTLHSHVASAQAVVEVLLLGVQLHHVGLLEQGQKEVSCVPIDEGRDNSVAKSHDFWYCS